VTTTRLGQPDSASVADESSRKQAVASPGSGRRWVIATTTDVTVEGYLPEWADCDPSMSELPLDLLSFRLADLCHRDVFEGLSLRVRSPPSEGEFGRVEKKQVLWGTIDCCPYAEEPELRQPLVNVALIGDFWIRDLDPDGVAELAALLRAHADRLDHEVLPRLVAARVDWVERGSR
jgi:hypothetical protein